jgi:transposase
MAQRTRVKLGIAHPNAAGIDIGSASHFVAVPPDRDDQPVREFRSFTEDLERIGLPMVAAVDELLAVVESVS